MQPIGHEAEHRYERVTVKERILREVTRRIEGEDWKLKTANWKAVLRDPIPDDYPASRGSTLAIVDGVEQFGINASHYQNTFPLTFEFAVAIGEAEVASTVLNLIQGELVELIAGNHHMKEGGDGQRLTCTFEPDTYEPDIIEGEDTVRGALTFNVVYRHATHRPHTPIGN